MEILVIATAAGAASTLTLFSGFGLGTLLMPVVALFFPVDIAIAVTAIVHLANNVFKLALVGRSAEPTVIVRFGVPAILAAAAGAIVLGWLSGIAPVAEYTLAGHPRQITAIKCLIGLLILVFVVLDIFPVLAGIALDRRYLPLGGIISGFFGGLSGHQGAFRSMFLLKAGLTKEQFVATGVVLAVMVDFSRIAVYGLEASSRDVNWSLVVIATLSAFAGSFIGARLVKKITVQAIRRIVATLLTVVAAGLAAGII